MTLQMLRGWRETRRHNDAVFPDRTAFGGHVVKGVERRMNVGDKQFRREGREQDLSVSTEVRRYLRALPDADLKRNKGNDTLALRPRTRRV